MYFHVLFLGGKHINCFVDCSFFQQTEEFFLFITFSDILSMSWLWLLAELLPQILLDEKSVLYEFSKL